MTQMKNVFGDNCVHRFVGNFDNIEEEIANLVNKSELSKSFIAGHLPLYLFNPYLSSMRVFTILREPVQRVLSLYRFLQKQSPQELARMDLRPGFCFDQFITSKNPELYSQINNGMCRQLANNIKFADPSLKDFWDASFSDEMLTCALEMVKKYEFGLTEDMAGTNRIIEKSWGLPYLLDIYKENTTNLIGIEEDADILQSISRINELDNILYTKACHIFHERVLTTGTQQADKLPVSGHVFEVKRNLVTSIADVSGRQGFHEFEKDGFAWLKDDSPGRIYFRIDYEGRVKLSLRFYTIAENYPIDDIVICINNNKIDFEVAHTSDPREFAITSKPFTFDKGIMELKITSPAFHRANEVLTISRDVRNLGIALFSLYFHS